MTAREEKSGMLATRIRSNVVMGWKVVGCLGALLLATGCGGAATSGAGGAQSTLPAQQRSGKTSASGTEISKQAAQGYKQALDDFLNS